MSLDTSRTGTLVIPPYMQGRLKEVAALQPDLPTYAAAVFPKSFFAQIALRFINKIKRHNTIVRFFFSREEGLKWLKALIETQS